MTMIISKLIGGLGNQLFQYAAGRALAQRHGVPLKLDVTGFETYGLRRYELDSFPIAATLAEREEVDAIVAPERRGGRLLARLIGQRPGPAGLHYREPHFHFDPALAEQPTPLLMDGYWQSERYFKSIAETLRSELTPSAPLEPANAATAAAISACEAVSVHVRRGDYVSNTATNAYHGVCSLDYYRAAIDAVRERVGGPHLFIFSDDAAWTRANLSSDLPTTYVDANPPDRGFRDMQLMGLCRHHVIANSSFSWWGAWLNPRPGKIVVAPERWFANSPNDTRDLVPAEWLRR